MGEDGRRESGDFGARALPGYFEHSHYKEVVSREPLWKRSP